MEILSRELDGVLYLALHLAKKGMPTLFGERMVNEYVFRLNPDKPVVYLDMDQNVDLNQKVLSRGGMVFNLNHEGLVSGLAFWLSTYKNVSKAVTKIFAWGQVAQEEIGNLLPQERRSLLQTTGHPMFDLVSPDFIPYYRDKNIETAYGADFILVNTNFAAFNRKMSFEKYIKMIGKMKEWKVYTSPEVQESLWKARDFEEKVCEHFLELVRQLSTAFPNKKIVVRPHPVEANELYEKTFKGLGNVHVSNEGSVRKWIASAGSVIHHDCTTGIEALLMGKPVVRFQPIIDSSRGGAIQSKVGVKAQSVDEVVSMLKKNEFSSEFMREQRDIIRPYLANLEGNATARIAEEILACYRKDAVWLPQPLDIWESFKCWRKYISKLIRSGQPGHNGRKVAYALNKFPRLPFQSVQERIEKLQAIDPDLPKVSLEQLALNTFLITPRTY